ncbi:unnamed protein product [Ranitomeya imitator]|uniref:CCHC-type domain-containing protein n=1 Tax=Ranitomeya imitator TaxID=111125 RepID=A0ABN9KUX1_9NEOB|nr:unnamed protein product [Ranitomeya imitator]
MSGYMDDVCVLCDSECSVRRVKLLVSIFCGASAFKVNWEKMKYELCDVDVRLLEKKKAVYKMIECREMECDIFVGRAHRLSLPDLKLVKNGFRIEVAEEKKGHFSLSYLVNAIFYEALKGVEGKIPTVFVGDFNCATEGNVDIRGKKLSQLILDFSFSDAAIFGYGIPPPPTYYADRGMPDFCRNCKQYGHCKDECSLLWCSRCEKRGHTQEGCKNKKLCNLCGKDDHIYELCPERKKGKRKNSKAGSPGMGLRVKKRLRLRRS